MAGFSHLKGLFQAKQFYISVTFGLLEVLRIVDYQLRIFPVLGQTFCEIKCTTVAFFYSLACSLCQQVIGVGYIPCTDWCQPTEMLLLRRPSSQRLAWRVQHSFSKGLKRCCMPLIMLSLSKACCTLLIHNLSNLFWVGLLTHSCVVCASGKLNALKGVSQKP